MRARIIATVFISTVAVAPGCSKKCKNPLRTTDVDQEGPAMQCHAVVTCPSFGGRPAKPIVLQGGNDPIIVQQKYDSWDRGRCIAKVRAKPEYNDKDCKIEVSPELICLDTAGGPDGSDGKGSTGIFVTIGVASVGSGDYLLYDGLGGAGGTGGFGGAGGFSTEPRDEGQGEI